ncbi:MAG: dTDP-4-dehydrorhamnose reductase [Patescibacteria group bacterium]
MKVLVTGAKGQLGHKISELLGTKYRLILTDSDDMDITDPDKVSAVISREKPDWIIHGAAYTQVDKAKENEALCRRINVAGTENVAKAAAAAGVNLIYISTDYVFDGENGVPYVETDEPHPLSVYGMTKYEGELAVERAYKGTVPPYRVRGRLSGGQSPKGGYYIIRTAWIFGELPEGHPDTNFVETMLHLAKERDSLSVVNDQVGSPTYTGDLVSFINQIVEGLRPKAEGSIDVASGLKPPALSLPCGIYHFSGEGACSWYDFAKEIFAQTGTTLDLKPISSAEYPQVARRPAYSYLSKEKIKSALGIEVRPWQEMLGDYLRNRATNG